MQVVIETGGQLLQVVSCPVNKTKAGPERNFSGLTIVLGSRSLGSAADGRDCSILVIQSLGQS